MSQDRELSAAVHPLLAIAIIILVTGIFAARYEFNRLAVIQPFPALVASFAENQLSVVIDNRIFHGNERGESGTTLLEPLGVQEQIGAIERFANGDWLLRVGSRDNSFLQNMAIFLRLQTEPPKHDPNNGVLMRCSEANTSCKVFNEALPAFNRTFGLAIAPDDTVYIADTSAHRLLKISPTNNALSEAKTGFEFPNQLVFVGTDLWLANTNKHEIARIDTRDDHFGQKIETINLIDKGAPRPFIWPVSVTRVNDGWWVLGKGNNLVGGVILRFDTQWKFKDTIALPGKADPAFLHAFHDQVYITDMEHRRVLRFDYAGNPQSDLSWPTLTPMLQQAREQKTHYQRGSALCLAAFVGVLLGGVSLVWLQARDLRPDNLTSKTVVLEDPEIRWIDIAPIAKRKLWLIAATLPLFIAALLGSAFWLKHGDMSKLSSRDFGPVVVTGAILFFWHRMTKQRIGVKGDTLILVSANGYAAGSGQQILYTPQHLQIGGISITLGPPDRLFPHDALMQEVFPLLRHARSISNGAMQMQLIRTTSWKTVVFVLAWIALIVKIATIEH